MPRKSYEAYRAAKFAGRRPSIVESETDAESLASYTTFQSGSSFHHSSQSGRTIPPPRLASFSSKPYPQSHIHTHNPSYAQAAYSPPIGLHPHYPLGPSYAQTCSVYNGTTAADLSPTSTPEVSGLELRNRARAFSSSSSLRPETSTREISVTDEERRCRRARREDKRRERAEKSTLKGEMYDSPLRSAIRWGSVNDLSGWSLGIGMAVVWVIRMVVGALDDRRGLVRRIASASMPLSEVYATGNSELEPPLRIYLYKILYRILNYVDPTVSTGRSTISWKLSLSVLFLQVSLEQLFWWSAVVTWNVTEGKRGGRSWRTQLTGIMTLFLQPTLTLMSSTTDLEAISLGLILWTVVLLAHNRDLLGCIAAVCAINFESATSCYLPAVVAYLAGKCLMQDKKERLIYGLHLASITLTTSALTWAPWILHPRALVRALITLYLPQSAIADDRRTWTLLRNGVGIDRWISNAGIMRLSFLATALAIIPTILILLYSSLSLQSTTTVPPIVKSTPNSTPSTLAAEIAPPTSRLLLPALLTCALTFHIFAHGRASMVSMPLGVMMSLRGGKEATGEHEIWEMGVLVMNSAILSLTGLTRGLVLVHGILTLLWAWVTGYSPRNIQTRWLRTASYILHPIIAAVYLAAIVAPHLAPSSPLITAGNTAKAVSNLVLGLVTWTWAHRKLIESSWAISGLTPSPGPTKIKPN